MRKFLIVFTLFIAIGAVGGAIMMWVDPSGNGWGGAPMLDLLRAKMPWPDIFFKDFIPSGFALLAVNGLTQLLAAVMLIKKHPNAYGATLACGIILMLWIVLEWWVWGFNPISNLYFVFGLVEAGASVYAMKK
ncbi:MAG: hypothetical protein J5478_03715 [Bacteroidales bacterium]|nr:hypothetical protein [Bacteroidales bacterium]